MLLQLRVEELKDDCFNKDVLIEELREQVDAKDAEIASLRVGLLFWTE